MGEISAELQDTLRLCRENERIQGNDGDSARVMRALADALIGQGKVHEGEAMRQEANCIRQRLQGGNRADTRENWDALVSVIYR